MAYTMQDIDAACSAILGDRVFDALQSSGGWSRPHTMEMGARKAWVDQRAEDQHTSHLRAALRYLDHTGVILPEDA